MERSLAAMLGFGLICSNSYASGLQNAQSPTVFQQKTSVSAQNMTPSETFLANNKNQPGVNTTATGLQYKIITNGTGAKPTVSDTVTVNYEGKLIDGKVFDSSYKRGTPISFGVTQVIPGWTEALQMMPVGSKWEVYIPANLAYGARGVPGTIEPNQALIFTVELLGINK